MNIAPFLQQMMRLFSIRIPGTGISIMAMMAFMAIFGIIFRLVRNMLSAETSSAVKKVVRGRK